MLRGYRVQGRVQGVGFRWFVQRRAEELGLEGWVRNRPDGTVEVLARGAPAALEALRTSLKEGPPASRVEEVRELSLDARDASDALKDADGPPHIAAGRFDIR